VKITLGILKELSFLIMFENGLNKQMKMAACFVNALYFPSCSASLVVFTLLSYLKLISFVI
jgi:hypothetical protein